MIIEPRFSDIVSKSKNDTAQGSVNPAVSRSIFQKQSDQSQLKKSPALLYT
jgi:hypothetical protein